MLNIGYEEQFAMMIHVYAMTDHIFDIFLQGMHILTIGGLIWI